TIRNNTQVFFDYFSKKFIPEATSIPNASGIWSNTIYLQNARAGSVNCFQFSLLTLGTAPLGLFAVISGGDTRPNRIYA
ncbi:MAG: hypothetical protein FWE59_06635, partial [Oscillospiraceae bacterium]|nr:hypothetical protein [Oscillospiraceae bacterium]